MENDDGSLDCGLRYRKDIGVHKDKENNFYSYNAPNNDLERKLSKDS